MIRDRDTLKAFFKKGTRPSEANFADLIDSVYNKMDDDVLSDYIDNSEAAKLVFAEIKNSKEDGLSFIDANSNNVLMSIKPDGKIGIGFDKPRYMLDVNGEISSSARVGTYIDEKVIPAAIIADGQWHKIIIGLDKLNIFEVTASAKGPKGNGDYALLYAIAMSTYGNSKNKIIQNSARYKGLFHNICLRWKSTVNSNKEIRYDLEIKTSKNFGKDVVIQYFITKLIAENE